MADASVLEQGAAEATATFDELFHKQLYRCAKDAYFHIAVGVYPSLLDCYAVVENEVVMNTTGVIENMFREHSQDTCSCDYRVYVSRGPHCWVDGDWYSCYFEYLEENGHSSYYTKVEESLVSEVVELGSDCYRFSRHPITTEPRDCSPNGGSCDCNLKIVRLTITCLINDLFVLRYPAMRCQLYLLAGGENFIRDCVSGTIIEYYNYRPILEQYCARLLHRYIPLFQNHLFNNLSQWVIECSDDSFVSEDEDSSDSSKDNTDDENNNASTSTV